MFVVERGTPGLNIVRDVPTMHHPYEPAVHFPGGGHAEVLFEDCRVPDANLIGEPGDAFMLAQRRLNGGTYPPRDALGRAMPAGLRHALRAGRFPPAEGRAAR